MEKRKPKEWNSLREFVNDMATGLSGIAIVLVIVIFFILAYLGAGYTVIDFLFQ